jgi:class 3 adenylate cyclase
MPDVRQWLQGLGLGQYADTFERNDFDWDLLRELDHEILKEIGVDSVGHRVRILKSVRVLDVTQEDDQSDPPKFSPALAHASPTGDAERRQLNVMFCDLAGSTAIAKALDPEEMREVNLAYQQLCTETIERFGGFVARFMGDGVLAYFGYPRAQEGDPERAVRAGLALTADVEALERRFGRPGGLPLTVRVGIATGRVVAGDLIGAGASAESPVVGETPNLAARLQALAAPGTVVIADETCALLGELFQYRSLGEQTLKGIDNPVRCHQVMGVGSTESRFEAVHASRLSPLVGRDEEFELLDRRWRTARDGNGQVVLLSGEAGIGKSRLIYEIHEPRTLKLRLQCSPHGTNSALHPIVDYFQRRLDEKREEGDSSTLDALEALIATDGAMRPDTLALFASMLSIPFDERYGLLDLDPRQQLELTLHALVEQIISLANAAPTILVVEDAHWADPTSLEFFSRLVDVAQHHALLVIISFRPEFDAPWPGESHVTSMRLNKLTSTERASLIRSVSKQGSLPDAVVREIAERADGVPLFLEELTRSVVEDARSDPGMMRIPATLHDSLMSRLDRLGNAKRVAQTAAVIGREFEHGLLAEVFGGDEDELESGLDRVLDSGLVLRRGTPPAAHYTFKHALIQDAAYENLLRTTRRELHARVAKALRAREGTHRPPEPERLAHHYSKADMPRESVEYRLRAGAEGIRRAANAEAAEQFELGLLDLGKLAPSRHRDEKELQFLVALVTALRTSAGWGNERAVGANDRARALCESLDDDETLYRVLQQDRVLHWIRGEHAAVIRIQEAMTSVGHRLENQGLSALDRTFVAWPHLMRGELDVVRSILGEAPWKLGEETYREYRFGYGIDGRIRLLALHGHCEWLNGSADSAARSFGEAIALARSIEHPQSLTWALTLAGALPAAMRRDAPAALAFAQEILSRSDALRSPTDVGWAKVYGGWAAATAGDRGAGVGSLLEGLAILEGDHAAVFRTIQLALLADVHLAGGDVESARLVLEGAKRFARSSGERLWRSELERLEAECGRCNGVTRLEAAERAFLSAIEIAQAGGFRPLALRAATGYARHLAERGRGAAAEAALRPAVEALTERGETQDLREAIDVLASLS